jgi:signal transduction histidine kinase
VATIAEQHEGSLRLRNRPGDGLTVPLRVTLAASAALQNRRNVL